MNMVAAFRPIFPAQALDPIEFPRVVAHQGQIEIQCMGGRPKIIGTDGPALGFHGGTQSPEETL